MPTACSTIEEVGSTGVGALTVAFVIFAVCAVVFLAKANTSGEQRKCVICHVVVSGAAACSAHRRTHRTATCTPNVLHRRWD